MLVIGIFAPDGETGLTSKKVLNPISERAPFGKLTAHPTGAEAIGDRSRQPVQVFDRMRLRSGAKFLQSGEQLRDRFLTQVLGLRVAAAGIEAQLVTNDAVDNRLGMRGDKSRQKIVGLFVLSLQEQRREQTVKRLRAPPPRLRHDDLLSAHLFPPFIRKGDI